MSNRIYSFDYLVGNWEEGLPVPVRSMVKELRNEANKGMGSLYTLSAGKRTTAMLIYLLDLSDSMLADAFGYSYPEEYVQELTTKILALTVDKTILEHKLELLKAEVDRLTREAIQLEVGDDVGQDVPQSAAPDSGGEDPGVDSPAARDSAVVRTKR